MPALSTRRPGVWDIFHLIRFISLAKGLFTRDPGHMAHIQALGRRCDPVIRL